MELNNSIEIPNKRYFTIGEVSNITHIKNTYITILGKGV
jgi:hypothetical protein